MAYEDYDDLHLLALVTWRESRGESYETKFGVACSIRNRVQDPKWWGNSYRTVILKPYQYSSFNANDVNSTKFPLASDSTWLESLEAAGCIINGGMADTTGGATHYFDKSLDGNPPPWVPTMRHTVDLGALHFYVS